MIRRPASPARPAEGVAAARRGCCRRLVTAAAARSPSRRREPWRQDRRRACPCSRREGRGGFEMVRGSRRSLLFPRLISARGKGVCG